MRHLLLAFALLTAPAARAAVCFDSGAAWKNIPFGSTKTKFFTVGFSASSFQPLIDGVVGVSAAPASQYTDLSAIVRYNNAGKLDVYDTNLYKALSAVPYGPGKWYNFRVDVDPVAKRYSVYVTPPGAATPLPLGTWLGFRNGSQGLANFAMVSTQGSHQVCDVTVDGALLGTASAPPPAPAPAPTPVPAPTTGTVDRFGVKKLYPTITGGKEWVSKWDNGVARTFKFATDPQDSWFQGKGDATYNPDGKGNFNISGAVPRMYIIDPAQSQWRNVEMTVYAKRVSDSGTSWGGIEGVARTNHTADNTNKCDTRGVDARFRYDGHIDFEKETNHPASVATLNKAKWSTLPYNTWIGYKLVVYDLPNGNVKLESWMDLADGAAGGAWVKVNELEDNGSNFGVGGTPCKTGISPSMKLDGTGSRLGSETGKPNLAVYWRSDNVGTNGLIYKKMSVREIAAP